MSDIILRTNKRGQKSLVVAERELLSQDEFEAFLEEIAALGAVAFPAVEDEAAEKETPDE